MANSLQPWPGPPDARAAQQREINDLKAKIGELLDMIEELRLWPLCANCQTCAIPALQCGGDANTGNHTAQRLPCVYLWCRVSGRASEIRGEVFPTTE